MSEQLSFEQIAANAFAAKSLGATKINPYAKDSEQHVAFERGWAGLSGTPHELPKDLPFTSMSEKGNFAFHNSNGATVLFSKIKDYLWFQSAYTPNNSPAWEVGFLSMSDDEMKTHIRENLTGWVADRCQFTDIVLDEDNCVE